MRPPPTPAYAELHCVSNFSFQRGASSAEELFTRARALGYEALAITDECTLAGVVRALEAAEATGLKLIVGSELRLEDGPRLVLLCEDREGYAALSQLISTGRRRSPKGEYRLARADIEAMPREGLLALWSPDHASSSTPAEPLHHDADEVAGWLRPLFPRRLWIAASLHRLPGERDRLHALQQLGQRHGLPLVATGEVHMHVRRRRALQDALTAIRLGRAVAQCGFELFPNGERHLRPRPALAQLYPPELLAESVRIASRCRFSLRELKYVYPNELVPGGHTPTTHLRTLTEAGVKRRWPDGEPPKVRALIEKELALIADLQYEAFFLTVEDIVRWARAQGILCQGRGSAANSVVCYCLGITAVGPDRIQMLFERFISRERNEPPDIDVDFEHQRREEVIQYIYGKYGRHRAALAATVICYRSRSAARDLARALGFSEDQVDQLSAVFGRGQSEAPLELRLRERGFDPDAPPIHRFLVLLDELKGFPRHLSQHVGGFIISDEPLSRLVPVENAAMPERTIIQWDKDDLETLGLLKVDCLALGMLSCIRGCFDLLRAHRRLDLDLAAVPEGDAPTYAMMQRADTIGVFQIESRAQMSMLPRLKPENFYELVIEVAIVRPGPIQGDMVHPYLRRKQGLEPVEYPSDELRQVFERTLGVPIFQEQVMQLAIVAAEFTGGEADALRRSMAAWKRRGGLEHWRERLVGRMLVRGYDTEFAERVFEQIKGFGSYGFPESHAASFALIAYVSAWLKCHHPDAFACALLNAQPMGFYAPAQIIADVRAHGVPVRPVDVCSSGWDCSLEGSGASPLPLRMGLRLVNGLSADAGERIVAARTRSPFRDVADLCARAGLDARERTALAEAGALKRLAGHRHRAHWAIAAAEAGEDVISLAPVPEQRIALRPPSAQEDVFADYASTGLSLERHPLSLIRRQLTTRRVKRAQDIAHLPHGSHVRFAGLVTLKQRPSTASGVTFLTVEDETGMLNIVVWRDLALRQRRELLESTLLAIDGILERRDGVQHLIAHRLDDYTPLLPGLKSQGREFH
ncbi:error-prone DNA polymerase [Alkalisalibacterium limincola]|uniref:Error-prone DNA polymerase n=1 Tax=Alkalisalibacterium limincola TaxID=2699169 RepID=A0A5C8KX82_9GAMM|nr:error-prone DNA polymerase [Alkalisalibacterium limincola]TXK65668.1 error-prone DNA polymerase [Alkalisalibacterium limincola]